MCYGTAASIQRSSATVRGRTDTEKTAEWGQIMMNVSQAANLGKSTISRKSIIGNSLIQVSVALVLAFSVPTTLFWLSGWTLLEDARINVYIGIAAAVIVGHYFFRRLIAFPGARSSSYVMPIFSTTFLCVVTGFFFLRVDYNRAFIVAAYASGVTWYFACHFIGSRARQRRLAVVPLGKARKVNRIPNIDWMWLHDSAHMLPECDGIVVDLHANLPDQWERFIAEQAISGTPVYHVKQIEESVTGRVDIEHLSENSFGSLIPGLAYIKIKQWIDVSAALVAGVILLPALILIALAVKLDSPGPAFFWQRRVGYRAYPFPVFKFRTMHHRPIESQDARHSAITRDGDDRITGLGRFLRRSRIDELPQILNILRGEMSWIGPRPEACALSEWYEAEIPFYRYRHIVRPGITGWAQVNQGHVATVEDVNDKLQYDFYYIKYFSPWLDMLIVFRTIRTMLTGFGSK
jgi:lipopolysaccharide/colanic/teichoic acid biosynthesis glycosyltransferase